MHTCQTAHHCGRLVCAGAVFDFSRSPVAVAWEPAGESFLGLPGLDIFGAHMRSMHLLFLTAATLFLGWRGFLMGAVIWVAYKLTSGTVPEVPPFQFLTHLESKECPDPGWSVVMLVFLCHLLE